MPSRWRWLPAVVAVFTMVGGGAYIALLIAGGDVDSVAGWLPESSLIIFVLGFGSVGTLLAMHRPEHPIGWLAGGFAAVFAADLVAEQAALLAARSGSLVLAGIGRACDHMLEQVGFVLLVMLVLVFPHGRVPGRRWRAALIVVGALAATAILFAPFTAHESGEIAIPALHTVRGAENVTFAMALPGFAVFLAGLVRIVLLLFRGTEAERRQIRWIAYVVALTLALLAAAAFLPYAADVAGLVAAVGVPAAIGIAVTRHRLYDIDRIISRTVGYAIVVGLLAVVFAGFAFMPMLVVGTGSAPPWVIAVSTLVVFALFNPVRRRVQRVVDGRFHRLAYNPEAVTQVLGRRLRDQLDPEAIAAEWQSVAKTTMQPSTITGWLKEESVR